MVAPGTLFDYLVAFVTIILAIAFSDMATSLHRLLQARRRVDWHPLPLLVALFVLLTLVTNFFELWPLTQVDRISYYGLLWYLAPQFFYFLAASAALPDEVPAEGLRLIDWYINQRRYLFATIGMALLLDVADALHSGWTWYMQNPGFFWGFFAPLTALMLAAVTLMGWTKNIRLQWAALAALYVSAHFGYSAWVIEAPAAVQPATAGQA